MPHFERTRIQSFVVRLPPELARNYEDKKQELGQGGFAKVILAEHIPTREKVAIKVMNKSLLAEKDDLHRAYNEIYALKSLVHPHICQLYEVYETDAFIYLVLEYCPGGELFDYIVAQNKLQEKEAQVLFRQIVSAVGYFHKMGYAHRDLKPENMLLDVDRNIKLIDFGLAAKPERGLSTPLRTRAGSALYASPELISGGPYFGNETDVWSLGVVLYALLCGFLPFDHDSTTELYRKIKKGSYSVPIWLSTDSVNLLSKMIEVNPSRRLSIKNILAHNWLSSSIQTPELSTTYSKKKLNRNVVEVMSKYYNCTYQQTEERILMFNYDQVTAFYFILCKMSDSCLEKFITDCLVTRQAVDEDLLNSLLTQVDFSGNGYICETTPATSRRRRSLTADQAQVTQAIKPLDGTRANTLPNIADDEVYRQPYCSHKNTDQNNRGDGLWFSTVQRKSKNSKTNNDGGNQTNLTKQKRMAASCLDGLDDNKKTPVYPVEESFQNKRSRSVKDFTNRLSGMFKQESKPRRVKAIYHVENTSTLSSEDVRAELERVLTMLSIADVITSFSNSNGYLFKCKVGTEKKMVFELEVCRIPYMDNVVGVRRKRLKGDVWQYKEIVEHILSMARI